MTNELHLRDLFGALFWRWRMIAAITLAGTLLVLFAALLIPARYTATAYIVATSSTTRGASPELNEQTILTKVTELGATSLLRRTADNLSHDPVYQAAVGSAGGERRTLGDFLRADLRRLLPPSLFPWHTTRVYRRVQVKELRRHLKIVQVAGSNVIAVHYTSTNPNIAALVANGITKLYLKSQTEERQADARRALAWLNERIPQAKQQLEDDDAMIRDYRNTHGLRMMNPVAGSDLQYADLDRRLLAAQAELAADKARLARMQAGALDTPQLDALRSREAELSLQEATLGATLGQNNPRMRQVQKALVEIRHKIGQAATQVETGLRDQVRAQQNQVQTLQRQLETVQSAGSNTRLRELSSRATAGRQLYEAMLRRREATLERLQTASSGFELVSAAVPPERPSSPNPLLFGPAAFVFFLAGSGFLAVVLERLNNTIRSEADFSAALGVPCIGFVPWVRKSQWGRLHQNLLRNSHQPYAEAIRSIVATCLLASQGRSQLLLVTSSLPGEGKTTLAVSFATYAARIGRRTILLDMDFGHPAVAQEVGNWSGEQSLDLLLKNKPVSDAVQRIPALRLDYIPLGAATKDPMYLFSEGRITQALASLREKYDCIVIDTAPLLAITEPRLLAMQADQILFTVKWDGTDRKMARNALDLLRRAGVRIDHKRSRVAGVLTKMDLRRQSRVHSGSMAEALRYCSRYYAKVSGESHFEIYRRDALRDCGRGANPLYPLVSDRRGDKPMHEFATSLEGPKDPRTGNAARHDLSETLMIALCAVLSGGEDCTDMAEFARAKLEFLRGFLNLEHGAPSHDTFSMLFQLLDPEQFRACFQSFMDRFAEACAGAVAIDGKVLRRSLDKASGESALHMVSAWGCEQRLVLGQIATDAKSNEIIAVPELLKMLSLAGTTVTVDALNCQRDIAQQIIDQGADYALVLKGNQGALYDDVRRYLDDPASSLIVGASTDDVDQGRIETRIGIVSTDITWLQDIHRWPGLAAIGKVAFVRETAGKTTTETAYYLLSQTMAPEQFSEVVRSHWGAESRLHWCLDVTMDEDSTRSRVGHAPQNLAVLRHMAVNLVRKETSKGSPRKKRRRAAWNDEFLINVLAQV